VEKKKTKIKVGFENIKHLAIERFGNKHYKWEKPFSNYKRVWVKANERFDETLSLDSIKNVFDIF